MKRNYDLGEGSRLEDVEITPSFPFTAGLPLLIIPDPAHEQIKGSVRIASGPNVDARTLGQTAMGATAAFVVKGAGQHQVGFKQVASFRFSTVLYAGLKESDGSIEESSTGLNSTTMIDCSANTSLASPWAPFYNPVTLVRTGVELTVEMVDQPGAKKRLQRRNSKRDRVNFLVALRQRTDFLLYLVVVLPSGKHVPVEGFSWSEASSVDFNWKAGEPTIAQSVVGVTFGQKVFDLKTGDHRFDMLANASLRTADTIVTRFNRAMFAAQQGQTSGEYEIKEFSTYGPAVTAEMKDRANQSFSLN